MMATETTSSPVPALTPPPGEVTNYDDSETLWKWFVLCQTACLFIAGSMFFLRVYIRLWIKRVWILEDWLSCGAFIGLAVFCGILTAIFSKHGGTHQWNVTKPQYITILYYVNISQIWYGIAAAFTKCAILSLYLRVFSPRQWSLLDTAVRSSMVIICLFYFSITIVKICQCIPREGIWDKSVPAKCVDLVALLDASGLFNIISDICILLVPLKGVWSLQMSRMRKIGIYCIFTVGVIAPVFSTIGFVMRNRLTGDPDQTYNQAVLLLWATAELATGVMIISMPTLPGILQHRKKKPSLSVVNGSGKSRSLRYGPRGTDQDDIDGDYYQLDGWPKESRIRNPQNAIITDIRGGDEPHRSMHKSFDLGSRGDDNVVLPPAGGIVKMVKIEQSNV